MCFTRFIALSILLLDTVNKAEHTDASVCEGFGNFQNILNISKKIITDLTMLINLKNNKNKQNLKQI